MERVPSSGYLGEHVARRVEYGWGTHDLRLFTPPVGMGLLNQVIPSLGASPEAVRGVRKLVNKITLWLLTPRGGDMINPTYGNPMLGPTMDAHPIRARAQMHQTIRAAERYFMREEDRGLPADEQLAKLELLHFEVVPGGLKIRLRVHTKAGTDQEVELPLTDPEIVDGY